ncbi:MAG: hypothetical protein ABI592_05875 [Acidobacteriota bacterium]
MSSHTAPRSDSREDPSVEPARPDANERPELGEKEQKFVIKLCTPIPA